MQNKQLTIVIGILEHNGRFLILRRVDEVEMWHHRWELPGGKIEAGESPIDALHREVREETGLTITEPTLLGVHTHIWTLPEHTQQTFILAYRAQTETDAVTLCEEENDAHQWVTLEEYQQISNRLEPNQNVVSLFYAPLFV